MPCKKMSEIKPNPKWDERSVFKIYNDKGEWNIE